MSSLERRERHRAELRSRILQAALELVSEHGLAALSIRAIAERIEYSSAAIYLYFESKEALLHEVAREGFRRFDEYLEAASASAAGALDPHTELRALGQAYVSFALENTAYFRVMFDLPAVASLATARSEATTRPLWTRMDEAVRRMQEGGLLHPPFDNAGALSGWALLHGLVTLYLCGHLSAAAPGHDSFRELVDRIMSDHGLRLSASRTP